MSRSSLSKSFILRVLLVLVVIQVAMVFLAYNFELAELKQTLRLKIDAEKNQQ